MNQRNGFLILVFLAAAVAVVSGVWITNRAAAQQSETPVFCSGTNLIPDDWIAGQLPLRRTAKAVMRRETLVILIIGTASSTAVAVSSPTKAYPEQLEAELQTRIPASAIKLINLSRFDQTAEEMVSRFDEEISVIDPALVLWETGTPDTVAGVDPTDFSRYLDDGVNRLRRQGADVVLIDPQYSPATLHLLSEPSITRQMQWIAQRKGISVFFRQDLMQRWAMEGRYDPIPEGDQTEQRHQADLVHACLGIALAEQIMVGLVAATRETLAEVPSSLQEED
jgi:hypothetical protein